MKILVTGFQPFGGESVNPAYEAVKLLPPEINGTRIIIMELPVVFGKSGDILEEAIERHNPRAVISVGQAGGRSGISIEKVAINLCNSKMPDNEGNCPRNLPVKDDGPDAYFAKLPVDEMVENIRNGGIPAALSYTAGAYVCNYVMYRLLYIINHKYPAMQGGFIHVPYSAAQAAQKPDGTPSMPVELISAGLMEGLKVIC